METVGKLKLRKPLLVNGENVFEIPYDLEALTVEDITEADRYRYEEKGMPALYPTVDRATQLEIFARAVEKTTQDIGREDIQRLGAKDGLKAMNLARDFMNAADEDLIETESPQEQEDVEVKKEPQGNGHHRTVKNEASEDGEETTSP